MLSKSHDTTTKPALLTALSKANAKGSAGLINWGQPEEAKMETKKTK
jgi:hypothetical protein